MRVWSAAGVRRGVSAALLAGALTAIAAAQVAYTIVNFAGQPAGDGTGAAASFALPYDIVAAPDGTLVVSDHYGASVRRVTTAGVTTTVAVVGGPGDIRGVAVGPDGTIYATNTQHHSIYRVNPDGTWSVFAGQPLSAGSTDGVGNAARFRLPQDVAVDALGRVYVSDKGNATIRRITPEGTVTTVAGTPGVLGTADGTDAAARFADLTSLSIDPQGNLVIGDVTLRRMTPDGVVTTIPIAGGGGHRATFLAVGPDGTIYTTPYYASGTTHGVYAVSTTGVVTNITPSHPDALVLSGITVTASGEIYVVEANTRGVKRVAGNAFVEVAGRGPGCFISTILDGTGGAARFCKPSGVAVAADGTVFVSDTGNATVRRISPAGAVTTFAGAARRTGAIDGIGSAARFAGGTLGLRGIVLDSAGNLFVADLGNSVIRKITADGMVSTFAGVAGQPGSADGEGANARFRSPAALALGPNDTLYVSDLTDHTIRRITSAGVVSTFAGGPGAVGSGDGPAGVARFNQPYGLAVDSLGRVWVADTGNFTIRLLNGDGAATTVAGAAGDSQIVDGNGTAARFRSPHAVAVEPDGSVLILDFDRVRRLSPSGDVSLVTFTVAGTALALGPGGHVYVTQPGAGTAANGPDGIRMFIAGSPAAPVITTHPGNVAATTGATATFAVVATANPLAGYRWQVSTDAGATWTDLANGDGIAGVTTSSLSVAATLTRNGHRYRVIVENVVGGSTSSEAVLSVEGLSASPSALRFAAQRYSATTEPQVSPAQLVTVVTPSSASAWTAMSSHSWVTVDPAQGVGPGQFSVGLVPSLVPDSGIHHATVTVAMSGSGAIATVHVTLSVLAQYGHSEHPFGQVDTPVQDASGITGAFALSGWALDDVGVHTVKIYRNCLPSELPSSGSGAPCISPGGLRGLSNVIELGDATFVPDARPDVEALYPNYPAANRAGWGFMILSNMLPNVPAGTPQGGVGEVTLHVLAFADYPGVTRLGRTVLDTTGTRVTLANDTITKPFGAIDTPTQGQTVSGTLNNFGWALTPDPGTSVLIPTDGSTINVFIDGASVGTATYNLCRGTVGNPVPGGVLCDDDVSTIFRGDGTRFRNLDAARGPIGLRTISTTGLTNGLHTISWGVTDSANRSEGIGSRYFTVLNGAADADVRSAGALAPADRHGLKPVPYEDTERRESPIFARTGFDLLSAYTPLALNTEGIPQVRIPELGRVELQIPGVESGALIVNGEARSLPIGVGIDVERGLVTWAPGPGYLGTYRLSFVVQGSPGSTVHGSTVDVTVALASTGDEPVRMHLDRVDQADGDITVHGWGLDPQAFSGAGIGAVHVWARRKMSSEAISPAAPEIASELIFLGVAEINIPRPDVAAAHGAQFPDAGFRLLTTLPAGEWEVAAYVWVLRTGRFEDARTLRIRIR